MILMEICKCTGLYNFWFMWNVLTQKRTTNAKAEGSKREKTYGKHQTFGVVEFFEFKIRDSLALIASVVWHVSYDFDGDMQVHRYIFFGSCGMSSLKKEQQMPRRKEVSKRRHMVNSILNILEPSKKNNKCQGGRN